MTPPRLAIVRPPGDSFVRAISSRPDRVLIDAARARAQHSAYCRLLVAAGLRLEVLPPDEGHPDACFTQDPAIVLSGSALIGRFGAPSRRGEEEDLRPVLSRYIELEGPVTEPATIEGGDLLVLGRRLVIGRSRRTNDEGIAALRRFAEPLGYEVVPAEVPAWALHLQTAATGVGEHLVLGTAEALDQPAFEGMTKIVVPEDDRGACNVLAIDRFVIAAGTHDAHKELETYGFEIHPTDLSEFERADGSPTCLSLLLGA